MCRYRGPRGSAATLDAGLPVTGWAPSTIDGVWQAALPVGTASRQLWVDGRRAPRVHSNPARCSGGPVCSALGCAALIVRPFMPHTNLILLCVRVMHAVRHQSVQCSHKHAIHNNSVLGPDVNQHCVPLTEPWLATNLFTILVCVAV